jgi:L-lactate utilization protein LutB
MGDVDFSSELRQFYEIRAKTVIENLQKKNMEGHFVPTRQEALNLVMSLVPPEAVVGRGDSMTLNQIGVLEELEKRGQNKIINPVQTDEKGHNPPREERRRLQREALLSDVYLTSTNAVTLEGTIVSTDGAGNRVAAMMFGPKKTIVVAGGNKIVTDLQEALHRIRNYCAPLNALRHQTKHRQGEGLGWGTLRYTAIIDGCQPAEKGRITVILVGEDLGI